MKKKYLVDGQVYEIPESEVPAFLKDFPSAQEARTYEVKGQKYNIPLSQTNEFELEMGLKKKDDTKSSFVSIGEAGTKASVSGTEDISQSKLALNSTPGEVVDNRPSIFEGMAQQQKVATPGPSQQPVRLNFDGIDLIISPDRVPAAYDKSIEGARQYAIAAKETLTNPNTPKEEKTRLLKELGKVGETSRLDSNPNIASQSDLQEINTLLGTAYTSVTPEIIDQLNQKRESDKAAARNAKAVPVGVDYKYDRLVKKVTNLLQEEVEGAGEIATVGGDTRSDLQSAFKSMTGDFKDFVNRMGKENMTNSLATGIESLKYSNKNRYDIIKRRLAEGKTLASTEAAELTNIGANIIDAQNLKKLEKDEIDIDQYYEKSKTLSTNLNDNFYNRPDILQKSVSDVIAKYYDKSGTIAFGKWFISDNEIDAVPASEFEEAGIDVKRPEVLAAIKNIKKNEGILPFDNSIRKDALVREVGRGFMQPVKGISDFLGNITTGDDDMRVQRALEPVNNYVSQRGEYFNKRYGGIADAFNGLGQFVSQALLMQGAVNAVKGLGVAAGGSEASVLVKSPEAATPVSIRSGTGFGNSLINKSELWGKIAVPYLQSYDSYYKTALEKTDNPIAAKVAAFTNAAMEAGSEQFFDNLRFGKEVIKNFSSSPSTLNRIAKIFDKGVFDELAEKELRTTIEEGLKNSINVIKKGAFDLSKEALEEVPVSISNFVTDALLNPEAMEGRELLPEIKDAFLSGLVSFSIPTIIGSASRLKKQFDNPGTQNDALMIAARNRGDVLDAIYNQIEDGEIDQEEANTKIKILNTAAAALPNIPANYAGGKPMEEGDKVKYLSLTVQEKILKEQNKQIDDDAIKAANEEKINEIVDYKASLINKVPALTPEKTARELREMAGDEKADEAINDLKEIVDADIFSDEVQPVEKELAKERPLQFLKTISEQLYQPPVNIGGQSISPEDGLVKKYGREVVELAKTTFIPEGITLIEADQTSPTVELSIDGNEQVREPLTEQEQVEWNTLTMEEKRALATQNIEEVDDNVEDTEVVKIADENAKFLLARMRGEEISRPIPLQVTPSSEPATVTPVAEDEVATEVIEPAPTTNEEVSSGESSRNKELVDAFPNALELNDNGELVERGVKDGESEFSAMGRGILGYHQQYFDAIKNDTSPKELDTEKLEYLKQKYKEGKINSLVDVFVYSNKKGREIAEKYESQPQSSKATEETSAKETSAKKPVAPKPTNKNPEKEEGQKPIKLSDTEKVKLKMTLEEKIAALQKLKIKSKGLQSNIFGIPVFVYNSAIDTVILGLTAGDSLTKAINKAIEKYKLYNYKNFKRDKFIKQFEDNLGEEYEYGNEEEQEQNKKSSKAGPNFTRPDTEGGKFNFFKNRDLTESGVDLRYLSGETIEEGTGKKITGVFNYDAKTLDGLLEVGQRWMAAAKAQFNKNATQYAEVLLKNLQDMKGRSSVKAVAMVNLLNTIDKDLKIGDLTKGQRDILKNVRRQLINEIAENAREGSLTLNAQRLIHKLYKGEYKFTETMAGIVSEPVQKKATNVSEKMKKGSTEVSETVRKQARSGKTPARPAPKKEDAKKTKTKEFFTKLTKGMSEANIAKLKSKISEIANGLNCRKKK